MEIIGGDSRRRPETVSVMPPSHVVRRLLLLHPEDSVLEGPWSSVRWSSVIDIGWAGAAQYADWSAKIACTVRSLYRFADWRKDVPPIPPPCGIGNNRLGDAAGTAWRGLLEPSSYQPAYGVLLLQEGL